MRRFGYAGAVLDRDPGVYMRSGVPLGFLSKDVLIATFLTRESGGSLASRDRPDDSWPLKLHAVFFESETGKVQAIREWPTPSVQVGILPAGDGKFIVRTGEKLSLYSPRLELIGEFMRSNTSQTGSGFWDIYASPSGRTILASGGDDKNE